MRQLEVILNKEITRKQFVLSALTAMAGLIGISTFLGIFTKNIHKHASGNPGYGERGYGP